MFTLSTGESGIECRGVCSTISIRNLKVENSFGLKSVSKVEVEVAGQLLHLFFNQNVRKSEYAYHLKKFETLNNKEF